MTNIASFDVLPSEIASYVCGLIKQSEVSNLSLVTKSIYQLVRPILYRHPNVTRFTSLVLFSRTISRATYMGKEDQQWSTQDCLDQTKTMNLTIDPTKDSQPPAAVMISRTIHAIVRRCPNLAITLCFPHCRCGYTPVSALEIETFPRVTNLVVYVGKHDPDETLPQNRDPSCFPNAKFWRPFVNGVTFPDCLSLEIRHYWATTPPSHASLDLRKRYPAQTDHYAGYGHPAPGHSSRLGRRAARLNLQGNYQLAGPGREQIGSTNGLKRFQSIILECPPEIDSALLMQLLGNPNAVASNLNSLELRFCNLDYETISKLLYHAPPNVKRLVLLCCDSQDPSDGRFFVPHTEEIPHLCPLIREFSKKLVHLEFSASTICRELFFDDVERQSMRNNGIETGLGTTGGAVDKDFGKIDGHAIRESVQACRKQKRMNYRTARVKEAIVEAKSKSTSETPSTSLFGGTQKSDANQAAARAQRETEALLDEEEEERGRLIEGSKSPWFRRIITYHGLCNPADTWSEMQIAAEMEEKGIEWVLANKELQLASQHSNSKPTVDVAISEAFREKYIFDGAGLADPVVPMDDSEMSREPFDM